MLNIVKNRKIVKNNKTFFIFFKFIKNLKDKLNITFVSKQVIFFSGMDQR